METIRKDILMSGFHRRKNNSRLAQHKQRMKESSANRCINGILINRTEALFRINEDKSMNLKIMKKMDGVMLKKQLQRLREEIKLINSNDHLSMIVKNRKKTLNLSQLSLISTRSVSLNPSFKNKNSQIYSVLISTRRSLKKLNSQRKISSLLEQKKKRSQKNKNQSNLISIHSMLSQLKQQRKKLI